MDDKAKLIKQAKRIRQRLRNTARAMDRLWNSAYLRYQTHQLHGGRMRNLDDAQSWLHDVIAELNQFAKGEF